MSEHYQVLIVGAGPGGYVAAIRAAQLGLKTAVVERAELGGVCLNWGCIPTKTLLRAAEILRLARDGERYGVLLETPPRFNLAAAVERSRAVANQLSCGVRGLLKKNQVNVLQGHARLLGEGKVAIYSDQNNRREVSAEHIILATGARPRTLPVLEPDGQLIWTAREAMTPPALPKSLAVIGAGAIGIEFASFYATAGSKVVLLEAAERILPAEDAEISNLLAQQLCRQGITIHNNTFIESKEIHGNSLRLVVRHSDQRSVLEVDRAIVAAGIVGNVENLGLENTRVYVEKNHIVVDASSATDEPGVYAIGDVAGPPRLAHKASREGVICVERIAGLPVHPLDPSTIPSCIYSHPQVASVGLTEAQALEQGYDISIGRFPFAGNGKAQTLGNAEGLVKTVLDRNTGEMLGAHLIGPGVTELIGAYAAGRTAESTEAEWIRTVFPHPSLSEAMQESVLAACNRALHI